MKKNNLFLFVLFFLIFSIFLVSSFAKEDVLKSREQLILKNNISESNIIKNAKLKDNNFEKFVLNDIQNKQKEGIELRNIYTHERKIKNRSITLEKKIQTFNGIEIVDSNNIYFGNQEKVIKLTDKNYDVSKLRYDKKNKNFDDDKIKNIFSKEKGKILSKKIIYYPIKKNNSINLILSYSLKVKDSNSSWNYIIDNHGNVIKKINELRYDNYYGNIIGDISPNYPTDSKIKVNLSNVFVKFYNENYYYNSNIDDKKEAILETLNYINFSNFSDIIFNYRVKYDIENGWDFCYVEIKENNDSNWTQLESNNMTFYRDESAYIGIDGVKAYTGKLDYWINESINLSSYINKSVKLRFRYITDNFVTGEGFDVTNIKIESNNFNIFYDNVSNNSNFSNWNNSFFYNKKEYLILDNISSDNSGFFNKSSNFTNKSLVDFKGKYVSVKSDKFSDVFFESNLNNTLNLIDFSNLDNSQNYTKTNMYYHINKIHDFFKNNLNLSYMDYEIVATTEVNNNSYCNAYYDGTDKNVYFGMGNGAECKNLALASDIIYHEYTHALVDHVYSENILPYENESGAINEGLADFFAFIITNDTNIGEISFGYTLRNLNNTFRYPDDLVFEVHDDSRIFSGALFDMQSIIGKDYAMDLIILSMEANSNNFTNFLSSLILFDDDNNNLTDGTPNMFKICDSFYNKHGIDSNYCLRKPLFNKTYPITDKVIINETENISFFIDYHDFDNSNVSINWYVDNLLIDNTNILNYTFFTNYTSSKNYSIKVIINDNSSNSTNNWNIEVLNLNRVPVVEDLSIKTVEFMDELIFNITSSDLDLDNLTYKINDSHFVNINNTFFCNTSYFDIGNFTFEINISDSLSIVKKNISIIIVDTIYPIFGNNENIILEEGHRLTYSVNASDPKGVTLTYTINYTTSFHVNLTTGEIINKTSLSVGVYYIKINVSDKINSNSTILMINVTEYIIPKINDSLVNLTVINNNDGSINISWKNDSNPKIVKYNIYRKNSTITTPVNISDLVITNITSLNWIDNITKLKNSTYYYVLTGVDKFGNENLSAITSVVNTSTPTTCTNDYGSWSEWSTCSGSSQLKTRTRTCYLILGNIQTETTTQSCTSDGNTGGSRGGGGGGATTNSSILASTSTILPEIKAESPSVITVDNTKAVALYEAIINVNETLQNIKITFAKVDTIPTGSEAPKETEKVFKYLEIKLSTGKDKVKQADLKFKVEKEWLKLNSINKEDIKLFRQTTQWDELQTSITKEDTTYVYYEAITPGFSFFKISGKTSNIEKITLTTRQVIVNYSNLQNQTLTNQTDNKNNKDYMNKQIQVNNTSERLNNNYQTKIIVIYSIIIFSIIIVIIGILIFKNKKKIITPTINKETSNRVLDNYIRNCIRHGINIEITKQNLINKGWKKEIIEKTISELKLNK